MRFASLTLLCPLIFTPIAYHRGPSASISGPHPVSKYSFNGLGLPSTLKTRRFYFLGLAPFLLYCLGPGFTLANSRGGFLISLQPYVTKVLRRSNEYPVHTTVQRQRPAIVVSEEVSDKANRDD